MGCVLSRQSCQLTVGHHDTPEYTRNMQQLFYLKPLVSRNMSQKWDWPEEMFGKSTQRDDLMASQNVFWVDGYRYTAKVWGVDGLLGIRTAKVLLVDDSVPDVKTVRLPLGQLDFTTIIVTTVNKESVAQFLSAIVTAVTGDPRMALMTDEWIGCRTKVCDISSSFVAEEWQHPFYIGDTTTAAFFKNEKESVDVRMMKQVNVFNWAHLKKLQASILELPFSGGQCSLFVLLPDSRFDITTVQDRLAESDLTTVFDQVKYPTMAELCIPSCHLQATLCDQQERPDKNMDEERSIQHQEYISIHHVTVVLREGQNRRRSLKRLSDSKARGAQTKVILDQPFMFFVVKKQNNTVLVSGTVLGLME